MICEFLQGLIEESHNVPQVHTEILFVKNGSIEFALRSEMIRQLAYVVSRSSTTLVSCQEVGESWEMF